MCQHGRVRLITHHDLEAFRKTSVLQQAEKKALDFTHSHSWDSSLRLSVDPLVFTGVLWGEDVRTKKISSYSMYKLIYFFMDIIEFLCTVVGQLLLREAESITVKLVNLIVEIKEMLLIIANLGVSFWGGGLSG